MADFTLSNGDEITFDLYKINVREYRELLTPGCPKDKEDLYFSRVCGIDVDKLLNLSYPDYQGLIDTFIERLSSPLADEKN